MLNLDDLEQFVAFYKTGTLSKVAEDFHISQPTITRTMKRLEDTFEVSLFTRTANRIEFNEVGIKAVELAEELLNNADRVLSDVQDYDRKLRTIIVHSCAPAPLWSLIPVLSRNNNNKTISSKLVDNLDILEKDFLSKRCNVAILPYPLEDDGFICTKYQEEHLYICVPSDHAVANHTSVTFEDINGYNYLLNSEIGFWTGIVKNGMPSSKFLVQTDEFAFHELMNASSLPFFVTDLSGTHYNEELDRIAIPITDESANVSYYLYQWEPFYKN